MMNARAALVGSIALLGAVVASLATEAQQPTKTKIARVGIFVPGSSSGGDQFQLLVKAFRDGLRDLGLEVVERRKANLEPKKQKNSGDPRPAHVRNFLECVKSRKQPVLNLELAHHVSTVAHLGNIAFRSGSKIVWDPVRERIVNDAAADKLVGVKYRKPWKLPYARRA